MPGEAGAGVQAAAACFEMPGRFAGAEPCGGGHINGTFAVRFDQGGTPVRYLVQRLNTAVFPDPAALVGNTVRVTTHLRQKLDRAGVPDAARRVPTPIPTRDGRFFHQDDEGHVWRAFAYVEGTTTPAVVAAPSQAGAAARLFGQFVAGLADLPAPPLAETIPAFHDGARRLAAFRQAVEADVCNRAAPVAAEIAFVHARAALMALPTRLRDRGVLPLRTVHNDAKVGNVLFDADTGEALCVVDLDTTMPGLVLYDFGDLVRTAAATRAEDVPAGMALSRPHFECIARGYWQATRPFITPEEKAHLVLAGKWMALLMGVRFLTDYLAGDRYYQTHRPGHNLDRCRAQFRLVESIERQEGALEAFVAGLD